MKERDLKPHLSQSLTDGAPALVPPTWWLSVYLSPPGCLVIFMSLDSLKNLYHHVGTPWKLICVNAMHRGGRGTAGYGRGENNDEPFGSIRTRVGKICGDVWRAGQDISGVARGDRPGSWNIRHGIRLRGYSLSSRA